MAGVAFITGTKYVNGNPNNVFYMGSVQDDGFVYFNDDTFFRCKEDKSLLQIFYLPKQIWVLSDMIQDLNIISFDVTGVIDSIFGLEHGGGSVAPNADVEKAVQWMIDKASNNYITYSQTNRNLKNPDGLSYDCSSFVITGFYVGGFDVAATYTGDMKAGFLAAGFTWHPGRSFESSVLQRGDILLNEALHTQVYIGNNQDVNCGSTPARVQDHSVDNYGSGWDGYLRYAV